MEGVSSAPEMNEAISTDQSSRSTKRRAKVWDHADSELIDGKEKAVCKYCKAHLSSAVGKGTTHLNRHISLYCHAIPLEERQRFLAIQKTKPDVAHVFDPVVFQGLIANYFLST
jgi:molybdenum cofactor biosynthesis enzyme MoaA